MIEIKSRIHPYVVHESANLRDALSLAAGEKRAFALADRKVHELYPEAFSATPAERLYLIEATEEEKSFERLGPIIQWLLDSGFRRDSALLVVGGGVVQDIGCFIASTLLRGVQWNLVPTTLLAQCDSCIGSKSSINVHGYKNQMGTFYPPHQVFLVFDVLASLPTDEKRSGMGEIIKLHLVAGEAEFERLRAELSKGEDDPAVLRKLVFDSLLIKQKFIEEDEFDKGVRNLLNYGHTFGHAYESATHYAIPHGIAVSLGVATATFFSAQLGLVSTAYYEELNAWLKHYYQPYQEVMQRAELEQILAAMKLDKKNVGADITCILTRGAGAMEKVALSMEQQVRPMLRDWIASL